MTPLDVDLAWLVDQHKKVDEMGGYTVGTVVAYGGNKILLGKTADGRFTATAEYEDADGGAQAVSVNGRSPRDVIQRVSKKLHSRGVIALKPSTAR